MMFTLAKELVKANKTVLSTTTTKIFIPGHDESPEVIATDLFDRFILQAEKLLVKLNHFTACKEKLADIGKLKGYGSLFINRIFRQGLFDWIIVEADGARHKSIKSTAAHEPVVPDMTTHLIHVTGLDVLGRPLDDEHVHRAELFSLNTGLMPGEALDEKSIACSAYLEINKACRHISHDVSGFILLNKADDAGMMDQGKKIAGYIKSSAAVDTVITASLKNRSAIICSHDMQK